MGDEQKTRAELILELSDLRRRLARQETLDAGNAASPLRPISLSEEAASSIESVFDAVPDHIALLDASGTIVGINAAWKRFAEANGLSWPDHGLGTSYLKICESACGASAEGARECLAGLRALLERQREDFILEYPCHSPGQERFFLLRATRFPLGDTFRILVAHENVTERRKADRELRKLSRAVEQSPSTVVITDTEGRIEYVNPKFTEVTGFAAEDVLGRNPRLLKSGSQPPDIYQELWKTITAGEQWRGEFCNRKKNGDVYWELASISPVKDADGTVINFVKVGEDITDRKRVEEALRREGEVNAAMAELSGALLSLPSIDDIAYLVLEHAKRLTQSRFGFVGYIDRTTGYLITPTLTRDIWDVCQVAGKAIVFEEFRGLWGWVLNHRTPLLTNTPQADPRSSGTPPGHIPVTRFLSVPALVGDQLVGELALANSDRDYVERDLRLAERLAAKYAIALQRHWTEVELHQRTAELLARNEELDAFSHTVAHDLENPVTVMVGHAEMLAQGLSGSVSEEQLREQHKAIARNARRISNIIDELLLLAGLRQAEVEMVALDMKAIVAEVRQRLDELIRRHQAQIMLPDSWPMALGHGPWVVEVWVNYLHNAVKYGGRPPVVTLGAETLPGAAERPMVRFWVKDNGPGLTTDEQARLFTPFTRLAQARARGHGLGLSIVRRIVEKLGGTVGVASQGVLGAGCVFSFTLPGAATRSTLE